MERCVYIVETAVGCYNYWCDTWRDVVGESGKMPGCKVG